MRKFYPVTVMAALALVALGASLFDWHRLGVLSPLFSSALALWSTLGVFVGSLLLAGLLAIAGHRKERQEQEVVAFVGKRIRNHFHSSEVHFRTMSPDLAASGLLGDNDVDAARRLATSTGRIIAILHNDARFFRYEPVHLAIRAEEMGIRAFSYRISAVQTLAIRTGILGTFVGLIMSLQQVQEVFVLRSAQMSAGANPQHAIEFEGLMERISGLMGDVIEGLAIAFGTSIAGIVAAILISLIASVARWREAKLIGQIQRLAISAQRFFRDTSVVNEELVRTAEDLREALKDNLRVLSETRTDIHGHVGRLETTARTMAEGLSKPALLFAQQASDIKAMLEQGREATLHVRTVAERMQLIESMTSERLERLVADMDRHATGGMLALENTLKISRDSTAASLAGMTASLSDGLSRASEALSAGLNDTLRDSLRRGIAEGVSNHLSGSSALVAQMIARTQRDSERQVRRAFIVYVVAILAISVGQIALQQWGSIQRISASAISPAAPASAREALTDGRR
ncbi:hypothetical protein [Neorhizobium sp. NCHU2750]|uniref:hypothetical protein n=1 Tax=Neorhizobium sp. NCHU2750 TaxID=1825976 RepID=UPI000E713689|nr:hypothetical protein NCHU2750_45110 [Neorhizobium sp. NCHU2750]